MVVFIIFFMVVFFCFSPWLMWDPQPHSDPIKQKRKIRIEKSVIIIVELVLLYTLLNLIK